MRPSLLPRTLLATALLTCTLHAFAGRSRPVEYTGSLVTNEIEVSATFPRDEEGYAARAEFKTLVETAGLRHAQGGDQP